MSEDVNLTDPADHPDLPWVVDRPNVLLSLKPEHAEAILSGEKQYEFRKQPPLADTPYRLVLYASSPVQACVGDAWVYDVLAATPREIADETHERVPQGHGRILSYFGRRDTGYALDIGEYRSFDDPVPLDDLRENGIVPPQNFLYLSRGGSDD